MKKKIDGWNWLREKSIKSIEKLYNMTSNPSLRIQINEILMEKKKELLIND